MRKRLLISCALIFISAFFAAAAFGQKAQRIAFKRGATKVVVSGRLNNYKSEVDYIIRLRAGQRLNVSGGGNHYVTVGVLDPTGADVMDYAADCHSNAEVSPTIAGDYKISVVECRKADAWRGTYKLTIKAE